MDWKEIENSNDILRIKNTPGNSIIYKHSPHCLTSLMAYRRLKRDVSALESTDLTIHIVDVINNRALSRQVAETFGIRHESPQILLITDGRCLFDASHEDVVLSTILAQRIESSTN